MRRAVWAALAFWLTSSFAFAQSQPSAPAPGQEKRIALVVGNAAYQKGALQTPANDAGLIAQTLQAAGFDVTGARDLDAETLRGSLRDFVRKVQQSGPDTVVFVYLAGYGVQLAGDNYFVPVDATIDRDTDVPVEALRVSDYLRQLQALPLKANIFVLDAARKSPFAPQGEPLAGGLALMEPVQNTLVAFNAAPGTIGGDDKPPYGPYAQALAEMIRSGGLSLTEVFDRTRLRVSEMTQGAVLPWNVQKVDSSFVFFERQPDAPPQGGDQALRSKPLREFDGATDAYIAALERDTLADYEAFIAAYPDDPLARRVRAIVAARREAITWRRTVSFNTREAYWSYIQRYPRGPHVADAHRRLSILSAALTPPPSFEAVNYGVAPPPEEEVAYVERPVVYYADPYYDFAPPPPPPVYFLPPPPPDFIVLEPPPPVFGVYVLPVPVFIPIPVYIAPPRYIARPRDNFIFANLRNAALINNAIRQPQDRRGRIGQNDFTRSAIAPTLPQAAAVRASLPSRSPQSDLPGNRPMRGSGRFDGGSNPNSLAPNVPRLPPDAGMPLRSNGRLDSHALPGANGQPLPARPGGLQNGVNARGRDRFRGDDLQRDNRPIGNAAISPSRPNWRRDFSPNERTREGAIGRPLPQSSPSMRPLPRPDFAARPPNEYRRPGPPPPALRQIERPVSRPQPPQFARPQPEFVRPQPQFARPQPQFAPQPPPPMARPQPQFARPSPPPMQARPQFQAPPPRPQMQAAPPQIQRAAPPPPVVRAAPPPSRGGQACGNPRGCPPR